MHPEIVRNKPGNCPICGMALVEKKSDGLKVNDIKLEYLLKPTNEFVLSTIPVSTIREKEEEIEVEALGSIAYDTRQVESISARVSGRVEKLYIRYRYQKINKGDRIMDIYSPEILTAQQNLLFLLKNDEGNNPLIEAAKEKLLLLGMSKSQLRDVIQTGKPSTTIAVYSNYSGHVHDAISPVVMNNTNSDMRDIALLTEELSLKEGMYVQKGQSVFTIFNPNKAWAILNIYGENQSLIKKGNSVRIVPETAPSQDFRAKIDFIEPFYKKGSKTLSSRVYFDNSSLKIPIGSQVKAIIFGTTKDAFWLPKESVLSLGIDKIAFLKKDEGFIAKKVIVGISHKNHIQILSGLSKQDSVAINAQFLMDSESFIKSKN
jgi:Cu(I)/Ag(I) efflux system membrane fusion protein